MSATDPLAPLGLEELAAAVGLLREADLAAGARFVDVGLAEPDRAALTADEPLPRRARAVLVDRATGEVAEALVCLTTERVLEHGPAAPEAGARGRSPLLLEDFEETERIVKADAGWRAALERRGVADPDLALIAPLAAGALDDIEHRDGRLVRALTYMRAEREEMNPYARPVEGLVAVVDLVRGSVLELLDDGRGEAVPEATGEFGEGAWGPPRDTLRPIEIAQPEGPSFRVDGHRVEWERWRLTVGWNAREGLVLHRVGFEDDGRVRPILHRASVAEMVVPYADPRPAHSWRSVFDIGEYGLGRTANSLELGCDCLGVIHYFDAAMVTPGGEPYALRNAVCMHEEDHGILWKHTDDTTGRVEVRRSRRLVVSFFATVGNYDYGFFWYLYLDGTIECEVKLTGILLTAGASAGVEPTYGASVAPGVDAAYHQHLFGARLHFDLDGGGNSVYEVDVERLSRGPENPAGNAFTTAATRLESERGAVRDAAPERARTWRVANDGGPRPTAYKLVPQAAPALLADPDSPLARRAGFAAHHLWVTRYAPEERHPAGEYPNQHPGGAGLPGWVEADRALVDADLVLWHTFGTTHLPRPEDWPVMPVEYAGFTLKPVGFFERNPTLDLPAPASAHACH